MLWAPYLKQMIISIWKMLKINGSTILSNLYGAYITANTALSGMPAITIPQIDFNEFFKNAKEKVV